MLSQLVRETSQEAHTAAEDSPFMAALMKGELDSDAYFDYIAQLAPIYEALETWNSDSPFFDRRLDRFEKIISDLGYYGESYIVLQPTIDYVNYLNNLIDGKKETALIAHHYVRYLGDLSGGQAMGALVARNLSIPPNFLSFYDFDDIGDKVRYKETYRENLDTLIPKENYDEFIDEAVIAFNFHHKIFFALGERWLTAAE